MTPNATLQLDWLEALPEPPAAKRGILRICNFGSPYTDDSWWSLDNPAAAYGRIICALADLAYFEWAAEHYNCDIVIVPKPPWRKADKLPA